MNVFLIDGTWELFRHFYGAPPARYVEGREAGAVRGVVGSVLSMLEDDVTHIWEEHLCRQQNQAHW